MKSEGWPTVQAGFKQNSDGDYEELVLAKSTDGTGLKIKGPSARDKRVQIHVHGKRHGKAVAKPDAGPCEVSYVGGVFVFKILDQVSIVPHEEGSILKIAS